MTYNESGYDEYMDRSLVSTQAQFSDLDMDTVFDGVSGNKILPNGVISGIDGRVKFDLDNEVFVVNDGVRDRVKLGRFDDGEYGLRIEDADGNSLMDVTSSNNIFKSSDGKMEIDLTNNQIRVYDDSNLRVIIGKV